MPGKLPLLTHSLIFIIDLAFVDTIGVKSTDGERCWRHQSNNLSICDCCKPGYTGFNCSQICPNCESRLMSDGRCIERCKGGFYGSTCDMHCSTNCIEGVSGEKICNKHDGTCANGCVYGHYGQHCKLLCSCKCHNRECASSDGRCNGCKDYSYHGDSCSIPCPLGCFNGTCTRNGKCIGGCSSAYYGDTCENKCGINCKYHRCKDDTETEYICTEGCQKGYTSITCTDRCQDFCKECDQYTAHCISCMENTVRHCENGDCVNGHVSCRPKTLQPQGFDSELFQSIFIPILVVVTITIIVMVVLWRNRMLRHEPLDIEADENIRLFPGTREDEPSYDRITKGRTIPGTLGDEITKQKIEEARKAFVATNIYNKVKNKLEQHGHVTILGASGEGKTTMSLMMAGEHMDKGYHVVFVDKIGDLELEHCIASTPKLFLIFDDIFGSVGLSTDTRQLRNRLSDLLNYIRKCRDVANTTQQNQRNQGRLYDVRIVFSSKSYNFQSGISLLQHERFSLFDNDSVVDLTSSKDRYTKQEKIDIFNKYRDNLGNSFQAQISGEDISNISETLFGFPLTCRLFFDNPSFCDKGINFFHEPLHYLKMEIQTLLNQKDNKAAVLALMLLCENKLTLQEAERPDQFQAMDDRFKRLLGLFPNADRVGICTAARVFVGTFFTGEDVLHFAHSSIYDACSCAMYNLSQSFVLEYCSYDFLFERIKAETTLDAIYKDKSNYIFVSDGYYDLVASRIYNAMKEGRFAKSVTHPILEHDSIVKEIFKKIKSDSNHMDQDAVHWVHRKDQEKGFLYWAVQGHSSLLTDEIENVLRMRFTQSEIRESIEAVVQKDNLHLLRLFLSRSDEELYPPFIIPGELLLLSAEHGSPKTARYLLQEGADVNTTDDNKRSCVHLACYYGNVNVLKVLMSLSDTLKNYIVHSLYNSVDIDGRTPDMLAALSGSFDCFELVFDKTKTDIKDMYGNSAIHLACCGGNKNIVQQLFKMSNINNKGQHDWTPVMVACISGHLSVFNFLVSKRADLTLSDRFSDSLLHLACQGGNVEIVRKLLSGDLNRKGLCGWSPVMKAVVYGHKDVFDLLSLKDVELSLVSDSGNNLLHLACQGGNTAIVQKLLSSYDINCKGRHNWTPIMYAVAYGHLSLFHCLLSKGADTTLIDNDGSSLVHLASQGGNTDVVKQLVSTSNINNRGMQGYSPVMFAVVNGNLSVFNFLLSLNADITLISKDKDSLLHLACQGGNRAIVRQLLPHFNINIKGRHGMTPAMKAAFDGHMEVLKLLIDNKADLTLVDKGDNDIVNIASEGGHKYLVEFLKTVVNKN